MLESPTKSLGVACSKQLDRSFVYIKSRRGPRIDPCGTRNVSSLVERVYHSPTIFSYDQLNKSLAGQVHYLWFRKPWVSQFYTKTVNHLRFFVQLAYVL